MRATRVLALLALIGALGLPEAQAGLPAPQGGILRVGVPGTLAQIDPACALGIGELQATALLTETLTITDGRGGTAPRVAARIEKDEETGTLRLRLKPERRFSDGKALTSADVKASLAHHIRLAQAPLLMDIRGAKALRQGKLATLIGVEARSPYELLISLEPRAKGVSGPDPRLDLLLRRLADPRTGILTARQAERPTCTPTPVGSGPFALAPEARGGGELKLLASSAHLEGRPALDELHLIALPSAADEQRKKEAGALDASLYTRLHDGDWSRIDRGTSGAELTLAPLSDANARALWLTLLPCRDALALFEKRRHAPETEGLLKRQGRIVKPDAAFRALQVLGDTAIGLSCQGFTQDTKQAAALWRSMRHPLGLRVATHDAEGRLLAERTALIAKDAGIAWNHDGATDKAAPTLAWRPTLYADEDTGDALPVYRLLPTLAFTSGRAFALARFDTFGLVDFAGLLRKTP